MYFAPNWHVFSALQNIFDVIQMLMEDSIKSHDLYSALNKLGITMSDAEFQKMLQNVDVASESLRFFWGYILASG